MKLLILSFSPIASDARVLKQVRAFAGEYEVTTCGYGEAPDPRVTHLSIPDTAVKVHSKPLLALRRHQRQYWGFAPVRAAQRLLGGHEFDLVLANDIDTLPLALSLGATHGVHADIHEYFPRLHEESAVWRWTIGVFNTWLCRTYLPRAGSMSTVSRGLAAEYRRQFGVEPLLVMNAAPFQDREPSPTADPLRVLHSGAALRGRRIHTMIEAMEGLDAHATLDLYLTANDPVYLDELRERAERLPNVTLNDPVPHARLADTIARFDIGVHILPPIGFNNANALPNKLFDYIQARLATVVGPTPEMAEFVRRLGCGVVVPSFDADDLRKALAGLTPDAVDAMKANAHAHAREVAADTEVDKWRDALAALARRRPKDA